MPAEMTIIVDSAERPPHAYEFADVRPMRDRRATYTTVSGTLRNLHQAAEFDPRWPDGVEPVERNLHGTGDYSLEGMSDDGRPLWCRCTVERKTLSDLYATLAAGPDSPRGIRWAGECDILAAMDFACIVVEASFHEAMHEPPAHSGSTPAVIFGKTLRLQTRGIHILWCCGRTMAERMTFRWLERFWRDHRDG